MHIVEGTSIRQPCEMVDLSGHTVISTKRGHTVISTKRPSFNTDYLSCRDINWRKPTYSHIPFMCYKWMIPTKSRVPSMENVWRADFKRWDRLFKTFKPTRHADPSSGTCAALCVIERWQPKKIGLIGMDWVLDNNKTWLHDARAEMDMLNSLVEVVDIRELDFPMVKARYDEKSLHWVRE